MLDWVFEGIVGWVASIASSLMDVVSGLFLQALGTDMTAMEEYFPFVSKAFTVIQYAGWAMLFLITVWQLFRVFGGPITEAENPWTLLARSSLFALLIGYAKPVFLLMLDIATAPYTALMEIPMSGEDFTFAGIEQVLRNGLTTLISMSTVVGLLLLLILEIALGWNYFKLLLETVERYIVVGVLCYTSPLAYCMGASKTTLPVFRSWCRMVGSQLLLLVLNVWFLRAFSSSVGSYIANGGALSNGQGSIFLWLFCTVAFLKTAQKFDSYLNALGLNVAQTGSGLGMEILMASKAIGGVGRGMKSSSSLGSNPASSAGSAFMAGFADRFKGNSYVRDAVVQGGTRMGTGGAIGFAGRAVGAMAARNGATLSANSIASVAGKFPTLSGTIAGDIADRSIDNYMPHLSGKNMIGTEITGGHIRTSVMSENGKETSVELFHTDQFEKPTGLHSVVTAADGSSWYQMAVGNEAGRFYDVPIFSGSQTDASRVQEAFPDAEGGLSLRTVGDGVMEAVSGDNNTLWYSSAYFDEPQAPHDIMTASNGVAWYTMQSNADMPLFEPNPEDNAFNEALFRQFIPAYDQPVFEVDSLPGTAGQFEVRHEDGSGTRFYDAVQYAPPRGDHQVFEDINGNSWYAVYGQAAVDRVPLFEQGQPVYEPDGENVRTVSVNTVRYKTTPMRYPEVKKRAPEVIKTPKRRR